MLKAVQNSLLSLIYPQQCRVCTNSIEDIGDGVSCSKCWADTRIFTGSEMLCDKCGSLLGEKAAAVPVRCLQCDDYQFVKAQSIGVYEKALAASIIQLKTSPHISRRLRSLIRAMVEKRLQHAVIDLIVPTPLSKLRKIERGYNQAELIADELSRITGIQVDNSSLARRIHTPIHRIGMDQKARELTVKNAFDVIRPKLIAGKNILLVDDVLTSGATGSSCAKELKKNGSGSVNIFTLARAVLN